MRKPIANITLILLTLVWGVTHIIGLPLYFIYQFVTRLISKAMDNLMDWKYKS